MRTESSAEIIEIIDDDDTGAFGDGAPAETDDSGGRRRVASVVVVAGLTVVVACVIASAVSFDATTRTTPTTAPRPTATPSSIVQASPIIVAADYYLADPAPPGFTLDFAEKLEPGGSFGDGGTAELWATAGATSTTGSWFEVSRQTRHVTGRNAYRTVVGSTEVVVEHDPASGQSRLSFTKNGIELEVTAFGWADRQLLRLADSASVVNSTIRYRDTFFTTDHTRLLDSDPATTLYGVPVAMVGYTATTSAGLAESFTITVAGYSPADNDMATRFALRDTTTFNVNGLPAIVGHSAAEPGISIVQLRDGDHLVTLRGNIAAERLAVIAATVHRSPNTDVTTLLGPSSVPGALVDAEVPRNLASGMLADGWAWTVQVSAHNRDDPVGGYTWWIGQPGDSTVPSETLPSQADASPSIETLVEHGRTYVLAKVPRSMTGAELHVNPNGLPSAVSSFVELDPGFSDQFAAYVFPEPAPFTAQIVDNSGATVAAWPLT